MFNHRENVLRLVTMAAANPELPVPEVDTYEIERDRVVCSQNSIHQADLILRKLISNEMGNIWEHDYQIQNYY